MEANDDLDIIMYKGIVEREKPFDLIGSLSDLERRLRSSGNTVDAICVMRAQLLLLASQRLLEAYEEVKCENCRDYMDIHCTCDGCCIDENWFCADFHKKEESK